jgi:hypothetical protein
MLKPSTFILLMLLCTRASCLLPPSIRRGKLNRETCQHRTRWFSTLQEDEEEKVEPPSIRNENDIDGDTSVIGSSNSRSRRKTEPILPPPGPETFPSWAYEPRSFFEFELLYESKKSLARVGRIHTVSTLYIVYSYCYPVED